MHELSVCQALIAEVAAVAASEHAREVIEVHVRVGPLSGIESPLLESAFPVAAAGTVARDATLQISEAPVRVACAECGMESAASVANLACGSCGNWRTQLVSGDELLLQRVVLQRAVNAVESHV